RHRYPASWPLPREARGCRRGARRETNASWEPPGEDESKAPLMIPSLQLNLQLPPPSQTCSLKKSRSTRSLKKSRQFWHESSLYWRSPTIRAHGRGDSQMARSIRACLLWLRQAEELHRSTDTELLERFVQHDDTVAFRELMHRHGPLVLGVANRILHDRDA